MTAYLEAPGGRDTKSLAAWKHRILLGESGEGGGRRAKELPRVLQTSQSALHVPVQRLDLPF